MSVVCGMQVERDLRVKAELEAADAKKTAEVNQVAATQRLQEQLESTTAETQRAAKAESELADSRSELQAALRAVQVSFGSPLCSKFTAIHVVSTVFVSRQY